MNDEGSHIGTFEAQSPGLEAGCLRFAGWVAPPLRKTRFQVLVALSWAGLVTRRVSSKGFEVFPTSQPPFPSLLGAIPFSPCRTVLFPTPFSSPSVSRRCRLGSTFSAEAYWPAGARTWQKTRRVNTLASRSHQTTSP